MKARAIIKKQFPDLIFKLRTVSFSDLAREGRVFLESPLWGMTRGNSELFQEVKIFVERNNLNIIVLW